MQNKKDLAQTDVLPENFDSLEEFWGFWDTHSSADYEDLMEPVDVEIELSSANSSAPTGRISRNIEDKVVIWP